ncbi:hypothetical protein GCM10010341_76040 [Streptomyces noursei]|nr:hypothetical protein GCM10010341_76040 [Streptomyces noursei]
MPTASAPPRPSTVAKLPKAARGQPGEPVNAALQDGSDAVMTRGAHHDMLKRIPPARLVGHAGKSSLRRSPTRPVRCGSCREEPFLLTLPATAGARPVPLPAPPNHRISVKRSIWACKYLVLSMT